MNGAQGVVLVQRERQKQILRAAYPTLWGPKLAALRMTQG